MGLNLQGYVLEGARFGSSNSPLTNPSVGVTTGPGFSFFPSDGSLPEHGYLLVCTSGGKLHTAQFGWVKNDTLQRFGYDSKKGSFLPFPGENRRSLGPLSLFSNSARLKVRAPVSPDLSTYPLRVTLGGTLAPTVQVVPSFSLIPPPSTVEVLASSGELNWSSDLLLSYEGEEVFVQDQTFSAVASPMGEIGPSLYLSPLPTTGYVPLLRIGYRSYLTPIEVADESSFPGVISPGEVAWARDTGRLAFSPSDLSSFSGIPVYYDGVLNQTGLEVAPFSMGVVSFPFFSSLPLSPVPPPGGDILVSVNGAFFRETRRVSSHSSTIPVGVVEIDDLGVAKFSAQDANTYMGTPIVAYPADLEVENGVIFRLFRSLSDPGLAGTDPDVTSAITVTDQKWAEPIGSNPFLFPPVVAPLEDSPVTVKILQGEGSYLSSDFPRLDRLPDASPTQGLGYFWKESEGTFWFGQRKKDALFLAPGGATASLGDPTIQSRGLLVEEETAVGSGIYTPLVQGESYLFDPLSGSLVFAEPQGAVIVDGGRGSLSGSIFTDTADAPFASVMAGDDLLLDSALYRVVSVLSASQIQLGSSGPSFTGPYQIRRSPEILAHRVWAPVPITDPSLVFRRTRVLGVASNLNRLALAPSEIGRTEILFGDNTVASSVTLVSSFTNPLLLPALAVEVKANGQLNFSQTKVSASVTVQARVTQRAGVDYRVTPALGFFDVNVRFFQGEIGEVSYKDTSGGLRVEPVTFLNRKVPLSHPLPTDTLEIPLNGKTLASNPPPRVYRSGRPVVEGKDYTLSGNVITFLPSTLKTKAFPSGIPVAVSEPVLVDFYVLEANGGEKTFSTLSPIFSPPVTFSAGESSAVVPGDLTSLLPSSSFLRLDRSEVVEVVSSSYDPPSGVTSIVVSSPFREDRSNPTVECCLPLRSLPPAGSRPELVLEINLPSPAPRGSSSFSLPGGDLTSSYRTGTVLSVRSGPTQDSYYVSGSKYVSDTDTTEVTLSTTLLQEFNSSYALWRSVAPVAEPDALRFNLSKDIAAGNGGTSVTGIFRGTEDISSELDTTSGALVLSSPLSPGEEIVAFYLAARSVPSGLSLRASYVSAISPDTSNGLLGQKLRIDFSLRNWDSFYARVVPISSFKEEIRVELEDAAKGITVTGSGPITESVASPSLPSQGKASSSWVQLHLENSDVAARAYLLYFHNLCDALQRVLEGSIGLRAGMADGRLRYDGTRGNTSASVITAANQIDDLIQITPSRSVPAYLAGAQSRFFPTQRTGYGTSLSTTTDGEPILDLGQRSVLSVGSLRTRLAWGLTLEDAVPSSFSLQVDDSDGSPLFLRPPFLAGQKCVIMASNGSYLVPASTPLTVASVLPGIVTFTTTLGVTVPQGSTLFRSPSDDSLVLPLVVRHEFPRDFALDNDNGIVVYTSPVPPYDGSDPLVPHSLQAKPIPSATPLSWVTSAPYPSDFPLRFPALDGIASDDDEGVPFPVTSPSFLCEYNGLGYGLLKEEDDAVSAIASGTYPTSTFTVDIDATGTVLSLPFGVWPVIGPRPQDLVRVLSGSNASTDYYRVVSTTASSVTLDPSFPLAGPETGVSVTFTLDNLSSSVGDVIFFGSVLTDVSAPFVEGDVGKTIVILSGVDVGKRRQISSYLSPTSVSLSAPLTLASGIDYRLSPALATYGGVVSGTLVSEYTDIYNALSVLYLDLTSSFQSFFSTLFEVESSGSATLTAPDTLADPSADFNTLSLPGVFVYVTSGPNLGLYPVDTVTGATSLIIAPGEPSSFSSNEAGASYQIVSFAGTSQAVAESIMGYFLGVRDALQALTEFHGLLTTPVTVHTLDPSFATAVLTDDLTQRLADIASRISAVSSLSQGISAVLQQNPAYYESRYAWIVARIHRVSGLLPRLARTISANQGSVQLQVNSSYLLQNL